MISQADSLTPHVAQPAASVPGLFRSKGSRNNMYRPLPAAQPEALSHLKPGTSTGSRHESSHANGHSNITHADWDELYHAIQVRLENCVNDAPDKPPQLPPNDRHAATKMVVLQCVDAMRQLHVSLTLEREAYQRLYPS